jgi:NTP pyrophosphatase (non-canonical NTP hydrolase)
MATVSRNAILWDVHAERLRQDELRAAGRFENTAATEPDPFRSLAFLTEEVGEVARAVIAASGAASDGGGDLRTELVQVAAVAVAWIERIDGDV